jgi:glycine/D-amino acid oxidase-like deaminating enzyme
MNRQLLINKLHEQSGVTWDVIVIGGGATGLGVALDSASRAIVFDHNGHPVASAQKEFTQYFPKPGWVEHDPEEIWSTRALSLMPTFLRPRSGGYLIT